MPRRKIAIDPRQRLPISSTVHSRTSNFDSSLTSNGNINTKPVPESTLLTRETTKTPPAISDSFDKLCFLNLPRELHVRILSCLRANCLAKLQQTCRSFNSAYLVHSVVAHAAEHVYPKEMTSGFEKQPVGSATGKTGECHKSKSKQHQLVGNRWDEGDDTGFYTYEHLRNIELLVIARVLMSPEPTVGFVVSKSWCKAALKWLEVQQEAQNSISSSGKKKGKGSKKDQRTRNRQGPENFILCPNVNSDITCPHNQLQLINNNKSARARRRLLDKKAWRILKTLYPESTTIESIYGECLLCKADVETVKKNQADEKENEKLRRKMPLSDPELRRFYTRTRGVPEHCIRNSNITVKNQPNQLKDSSHSLDDDDNKPVADAIGSKTKTGNIEFKRITSSCPLVSGTYYVLPRSWCHGWRRYMKTGEGGMTNTSSKGYSGKNTCAFPPPDAAVLLCDAHNMALLPPHFEAYLYDNAPIINGLACLEQKQLLRSNNNGDNISSPVPTPGRCQILSPSSSVVVGQAALDESIFAMRAAGLSEQEISVQLSAMQTLEQNRRRRAEEEADDLEEDGTPSQRARSGSISNSELLDRENHAVVEILSKDEFLALERCWPGTTVFAVPFTVVGITRHEVSVSFNTPLCRECDATGRQCSVVIKNRARNWVRKSADKARAPASLEY